jgi:predicted sugar kinase
MSAAATNDFQAFSRAMYEFGRSVGEYFAPVQGDTFADPRMAALSRKLRAEGVEGVGQTSWGPTLFVLCDGPDSAELVAGKIRESSESDDCAVRVVAARNHGASVNNQSV